MSSVLLLHMNQLLARQGFARAVVGLFFFDVEMVHRTSALLSFIGG